MPADVSRGPLDFGQAVVLSRSVSMATLVAALILMDEAEDAEMTALAHGFPDVLPALTREMGQVSDAYKRAAGLAKKAEKPSARAGTTTGAGAKRFLGDNDHVAEFKGGGA